MFLTDDCFHRFHIPCFKEYAIKRLTTVKSAKGDVVFEDALCGLCHKVVALEEIKEMMNRDEIAQIESMQMDQRIEHDPKMVRCECATVILFEPSKTDYKQKDD